MDQENKINKNHSLGRLYPAKKTKPRSPDCTGKLHLKRDHLPILLKQLEQSQGDDIASNIAGWKGNGVHGPYMTIEISPRYERRVEVIDADPFAGFLSAIGSM